MQIFCFLAVAILCIIVLNIILRKFTDLTGSRIHLEISFAVAVMFLMIWVVDRYSETKSTVVAPDNIQPVFSHVSGFYDREFDLEITCRPDWSIYYTMDGGIPDSSSTIYAGPIRIYDRSDEPNIFRSIPNFTSDWYNDDIDLTPVSKAVVIRAVAMSEEGDCSSVVTETYFVGQEPENAAVASLVADPDHLFGEDGIYVTGAEYDNWYQNGQEGDAPTPNYNIHGMECEGNLTVFIDKKLYLTQPVGIRIQGASQRAARFKRLSVFSRKQYSGSKYFNRELFPDKRTHAFGFRSGFENEFAMYTPINRDVSVLKSFPVSVYLNGEYWYDTYLQERYNDTYFKETYGVKEVEFIKHGITDEITEYLQNNDLSDDSKFREFGNMVDIQSFIDYLCINIYLGNADYSYMDNIAMWRSTIIDKNNPYADGRWRYCLYDMDLETSLISNELGLECENDAEFDSFHYIADWSVPVCEWPMFTALKANETFCRQFVVTFMDIANCDFNPDRISALLEEHGKDITYRDEFFLHRKEFITKYLEDEFGLTGTREMLKISISGENNGEVYVNTCKVDPGRHIWEGEYYTDYPVRVYAYSHPGYRFAGWDGDISSSDPVTEVTIPTGGIKIRAVFERDQ